MVCLRTAMLLRMCTQIAKLLLLTLRAEVGALRCMLILPCWRLPFLCKGVFCARAGRVAAGQFHVFFNGYPLLLLFSCYQS